MRELSYRPEWRVTFITTSRRTLRDIELQTKAISTFDLIFYKYYLGMFTETDMQEYFSRLSSVGLEIKPFMRERMEFYCGWHPYLLEMLGYEIMELFRESQKVNIDQAALRIERSFIDQYDHMVGILSEDGSINKMLQILFGPIIDVKQIDVDEFLRYGLIRLTDQGNYAAFSPHFQMYLKMIERVSDLWPIWSKTEIALRNVIAITMIKQYGENWIDHLKKARPHLKNIFEICREAQQKEERRKGHLEAEHPII